MATLRERCHEMVCHHITEVDSDGCHLFSHLKQLNALLDDLELERSDLNRTINQQYSPIIHQFPHDVLSIVFSFCLPDHTNFHTSLSKFDLSAPLILGAVCKDWRETAWSNPRLWSAMAIYISGSYIGFELQTSLAHEWLARSGQLPLSIRIASESSKSALDDAMLSLVPALSTVINNYSSRWQNLHLAVPPRIYHIFYGPDSSAPMLETVRLHSYASGAFHVGDQKLRLFRCPRLQEMKIKNVSICWIKVPRVNITRIYAESLSIEDCMKILCKNPSLVHCEFMGIQRWSDPDTIAPLSTNLKHLTIQVDHINVNSENVADFLNLITVPFLETLRIEPPARISEYIDSVEPSISGIRIHSLHSLLVRSACLLRELSIVEVRCSIDSVIKLLQAIPTLKILTISTPQCRGNPGKTEMMLQVLSRVITSQGQSIRRDFLPNLETLTLVGHGHIRPSKLPHPVSRGPWVPNFTTRRPLHSVTLKFYDSVEHLRIPKEATSFFLSLNEYGIIFKMYTSDNVQVPLQLTIESSPPDEEDWIQSLDLGLGENDN